jgi:hypothetical protein
MTVGAYRGQQRERELHADHGGGADRVARLRAQPVDPGADKALKHLRNLGARALPEAPHALFVDQGTGLHQRGQAFLKEQRISVGAGQYRIQNVGADGVTDDGAGEVAFGFGRERGEGYLVGGEGRQVETVGAAGGQDQQRPFGNQAG